MLQLTHTWTFISSEINYTSVKLLELVPIQMQLQKLIWARISNGPSRLLVDACEPNSDNRLLKYIHKRWFHFSCAECRRIYSLQGAKPGPSF